MNARSSQAGFSLVEVIIAILVVGICLSGTLWAMRVTVTHSSQPLSIVRSALLAQMYFEELKAYAYSDPTQTQHHSCSYLGPEPNEKRDEFDDVDDLNGLNETPPTIFGSPLPEQYRQFKSAIVVTCESSSAMQLVKRIELTITDSNGSEYRYWVYRGNDNGVGTEGG